MFENYFYLVEDMIDFYGHTIQKDNLYLEGYYLERTNEKKMHMEYKILKKHLAYILPAQVFCPAVAIDEKTLQLSITDYLFLCDSMQR